MGKRDDKGKLRFEWVLKQRGYQFWDEDNLHKTIEVKDKKPDFYVENQWGDFLVEIESFKISTDIDANPIFSLLQTLHNHSLLKARIISPRNPL
jgi:hypothetical protein